MIEFRIPILPPSVNKVWLQNKGRGVRLSQEAKDFRVLTKIEAMRLTFAPVLGPVRVDAIFFTWGRQTVDIDNFGKVLFDALAFAGFFANDRQVTEQHFYRGPESTRAGGETLVRISHGFEVYDAFPNRGSSR